MSKRFIPQFSGPDSSREFTAGETAPGQRPGVLPLEWPPLQAREGALKWEQALKEKEEKLLKHSKEKALRMEKEAYEKGFAQGEKDGLEFSQKRLETALESFAGVLGEMNRLGRELEEETEKEMVRLIFALTRKIARSELAFPEQTIRETLRAAFQQVIEPRRITVHVNPKDHQYLQSHPGDVPWRGEGASGLQIVPDSSITRGGCSLETSFGEIDARLEAQLDQVLAAVSSRLDLDAPKP